jgi:hypothetical protein
MEIADFLTYVAASTQHKRFYHFTDRRNLDSIRAHGLLCTAELRRLGMLPNVVTGGDANSRASDTRNGVDKYVCLCFTTGHPMRHVAANDERKLDPVWLQIDPAVITLPGVMVTNAPSNQNGVVPHAANTGLGVLDLEIIYKWTDWTNPVFKARIAIADKYEVLVPGSVPIGRILGGL